MKHYTAIIVLILFSTVAQSQTDKTIGQTFAYEVNDTLVFKQNGGDIGCQSCGKGKYQNSYWGFTVIDKIIGTDSIVYHLKMLPEDTIKTLTISNLDSPAFFNDGQYIGLFQTLLTESECFEDCITGANSYMCGSPGPTTSTYFDNNNVINKLNPKEYHYTGLDQFWYFTVADTIGVIYFSLLKYPLGTTNPHFTRSCNYELAYCSPRYGTNADKLLSNKSIGIADNNYFNNQMYIYPNPVKDKLFINSEFMPTQPSQVSIYSAVGKQMLNIQVNEYSTIDISSLVSGMYFIKFTYQNSSFTTKVFKE